MAKFLASIGVTRALEATRSWKSLRGAQAELLKTLDKIDKEQASLLPYSSGRGSSTRPSTLPDRGAVIERLRALRDLPSRMVIIPPVATLLTLSAGVDLAQSTGAKDGLLMAFYNGWQEGLEALKDSLDDKFGQLRRAVHKGEMDWQAGDGVLLRFTSASDIKTLSDSAHPEDNLPIKHTAYTNYLKQYQLQKCSPEEARRVYLDLSISSCTFCVTADCAAEGGVTDIESQIASPLKTSAPYVSLQDLAQTEWRRDFRDHSANCGHLFARTLWDE